MREGTLSLKVWGKVPLVSSLHLQLLKWLPQSWLESLRASSIPEAPKPLHSNGECWLFPCPHWKPRLLLSGW